MGFFSPGNPMKLSCLLRPLALPLLAMLAGQAGAATAAAQVEQAARAQLQRQLEQAQLSEPQFELALVAARPAPPCAQPLEIEPLDTRQLARMRFAVRCPAGDGWRLEYVVRAHVSAMVAVAASPVAAGETLTDAAVTLERRDITLVPDAVGDPQAVVGQSSRRMLRAGDILRSGQLAAPVLVKRGDQVVMLARRDGVEVSTSGEALDSGARGAVVRVRNGGSGQVVRMRVTAAGTVEPVDMARISR
jgi:flagella basal body P-ring formation protein FlgA